jgi:hypothetical protein
MSLISTPDGLSPNAAANRKPLDNVGKGIKLATRAKKWVFHDEHAPLLAQIGGTRWLLVAAAGEAGDGQRNGAVSGHRRWVSMRLSTTRRRRPSK